MIIGLTGGIGSGKTTVAKMLADRGFNIIDADALSREVVLPGSDALKELASEFGLEILNSDGSLNRKKLSDIAFASSENIAKLNRIVTGRVIELAKERMSGSCVFDAPTLFENNLQNLVDVVILVTAERDERVARVVKRDGFTRHDVLFRMARQMPEEEKIKLADIVIYNNGSIEELEHAVTDALNCDKIKR